MPSFQLRSEDFKANSKKLLNRKLVIFGSILITFPVIIIANTGFEVISIAGIGIATLWMICLGFISYRLTLKKEKKQWASFTLILEDGELLRQIDDIPDFRLALSDVVKVEETSKGDLIFKTADKLNSLGIPGQLTNKRELLEILKNHGFEIVPNQINYERKAILSTVLLLASYAATFSNGPLWLVVPAGLASVGFMLYSFVHIQRNDSIPPKLKRGSYGFLFMILVILGRIWMSFNFLQY